MKKTWMLCAGYILKSASWKQCTSLVTERAHTDSSSLHFGCLEGNKNANIFYGDSRCFSYYNSPLFSSILQGWKLDLAYLPGWVSNLLGIFNRYYTSQTRAKWKWAGLPLRATTCNTRYGLVCLMGTWCYGSTCL